MKTVDAMGKACPLPVIEAKKALEAASEGDIIQILVDNEIAVQNLTKLAQQKHYVVSVTNMYVICETMMQAGRVVRP